MNQINTRRVAIIAASLLAGLLLLGGCDKNPDHPAETPTQTETEHLTEFSANTQTETELGTETVTETEFETITEAETPTETATETVTETETETVTETVTETETEIITESETEVETELVYYVCNDSKDPVGTAFRDPYTSLKSAKNMCDRMAVQGYRVVASTGEVVYLPYTELQCDILRECKWVTDYVRENHFTYGDAAVNPAISHRDKKVSCDRLVCWVMYRVGFIDQPRQQGVVVSAMAGWCERNGFERIDRVEDLQPGDIVLVNWNGSYPAHTFIHAGFSNTPGQLYRYDCGSNTRIQSVQPSCESLSGFWRAYRAPALETEAE